MIIKIRHSLQMAHRLWNLPGKCQNIHGHTWTVILGLEGDPNENGILIDYHDMKSVWRGYLDDDFDHRLVLDTRDPLLIFNTGEAYPGLILMPVQPTVEMLASGWALAARRRFNTNFITRWTVEVWEGENNCAIATVK